MGADASKSAAARAAAALVESGMVVGLGSGSTASLFIRELGSRVGDGLAICGVATSLAGVRLATDSGIPLIDLPATGVDLAVDGADAVDPQLRLIKGFGGSHVRERIVDSCAGQFVVVVDETKPVERLSGRVPVEVLSFGLERTLGELSLLGASFTVRMQGKEFHLSDNGNVLADGHFGEIDDPEGLADRLDAIPGLVGHGLFLNMADCVLVGYEDGRVEKRSRGAP